MRYYSRLAVSAALSLAVGLPGAYGQLRVEACREKARANYPLARQAALIEEGRGLDLAMARRGSLPRLSVSGRASYQSDATSISTPLFGLQADKDQYLALAELSQPLWDGGAVRAKVAGIDAAARVDASKLEVDLYALNARVDQLFFGVLAVNEQLRQNGVLEAELESSRLRVEACVANGVANRADLDAVRVEQLSARQRAIELAAAGEGYRQALAALIGEPIAADLAFVMPAVPAEAPAGAPNSRPELALLDAQAGLCDAQEGAARAAAMPRLSAFFQAAYGKPGLNMLKADLEPYWIGGLRLSWSSDGLADLKDALGRIDVKRREIQAQRDAFLLNSRTETARLESDIGKLRALLASDDEIIALREGLRKTVEGKVENGVATTEDLLRAIDAESLARQARSLHEVLLAKAAFDLRNALNG